MAEQNPKNFIYYTGSLFLVALTVAVVWQMSRPSWFQNIKAEVTSQPYARTIMVTGEGKINAKPDIALVNLSVVSKGATVRAVTQANTQQMNAVIDAIKKLDIDAKDIATSQYNLYPEYPDYLAKQAHKITGYSLDQQLTVKIRDLQKIDDVLDSATKLGVNEVGSLTFDIDDTGSVKKQAREMAFIKAREKAQEMAKQAGVKLGRVVTFSEDMPIYPRAMMNYSMNASMPMSDSASETPSIQPGQKELNMSVSVTYEIE